MTVYLASSDDGPSSNVTVHIFYVSRASTSLHQMGMDRGRTPLGRRDVRGPSRYLNSGSLCSHSRTRQPPAEV